MLKLKISHSSTSYCQLRVIKPMIQRDLRSKDIKAAFISLMLPYYCLYRSLRSKE